MFERRRTNGVDSSMFANTNQIRSLHDLSRVGKPLRDRFQAATDGIHAAVADRTKERVQVISAARHEKCCSSRGSCNVPTLWLYRALKVLTGRVRSSLGSKLGLDELAPGYEIKVLLT